MTETRYALTRMDIAALRKADRVSFHYNVRHVDNGERRSFIRAHKEPTYAERERDPFAREQIHEIDLGPNGEHHRVINYGDRHDGGWSAFESVMAAQVTETWRTVVRSLKVGETIVMHWTRDNNSETIRKADLHVDELTVSVGKEGAQNGARWYHIATRITPDNTARMVQRI